MNEIVQTGETEKLRATGGNGYRGSASTMTTLESPESFTYQHGRLTYHELTIKDRFPEVDLEFDREGYIVGEPQKLEELTVGSFRREYGIIRKVPENVITAFPQRYQWCIQQYNQTPSEEEKAAHPEDPRAYFTTCDCSVEDVSPFGIYNPLNFGLNLERRLSGKGLLDTRDIEFAQGIYSQLRNYAEQRGLPAPRAADVGEGLFIISAVQKSESPMHPYTNGFFTGPEEVRALWRIPLLLGREDYLDLMAIHGWVASGNDDIYKQNLGDAFYLQFLKHGEELREHADSIPLERRIGSLQRAHEHLKGFSAAASELEDVTTHEKAEKLSEAFIAFQINKG